MTAIERAAYQPIAELLPFLGYGEKDANSDLWNMGTYGHKNFTFVAKYFDDLWNSGYKFYNGRKQGNEWCDMTVDWAMCQAFGPENARRVLYQPMESCGAGCAWSAAYFRANNAWTTVPKTGDQVFFGPKGNESHTGLVEKVDDTRVYTIEGNTSDRLMRRIYQKNDSKIAGYGRPNYQAVAYLFEEDDDMTEKQTQAMIEKAFKAYTPPAPSKAQVLEALGDKWVETFRYLPDWAKAEVMELIQLGALRGVKPVEDPEDTVIQMTLSAIRCCIVSLRLAKALVGEAPREVLANELEKLLEQLRGTE